MQNVENDIRPSNSFVVEDIQFVKCKIIVLEEIHCVVCLCNTMLKLQTIYRNRFLQVKAMITEQKFQVKRYLKFVFMSCSCWHGLKPPNMEITTLYRFSVRSLIRPSNSSSAVA
jgi:hypothetical protein